MNEVIPYLQNAVAVAFVLLGIATAYGWAKRRDPSLGFLALAIVLLAVVSGLGRIPAAYVPPVLPQISLLLFMASGYALLRFRGSLIPLTTRWHVAAIVLMVVGSVAYLVAEALVQTKSVPSGVLTTFGVGLIVIWSATIVEPIWRFWLVARNLPAVQAWRLRSLSFGFGGLVAVLLFAVASLAFTSSPVVQLVIELAALAIVPLLYVSFSPPSWLRRQWRSAEEEGLRAFMQDLLLLSEDPVSLAHRALEWAMRLVGGVAAVLFDADGAQIASRGLAPAQLSDLERSLPNLGHGVSRYGFDGEQRTMLVLPIASAGPEGHLVVLAGPFTPSFGADELSRVQQFMSAVSAALDRTRLLEQLKRTNAELLEANRHKTVFLTNMSHELRTPLNAILGFSELLIDSDHGPARSLQTRLQFLEHIHSAGKHLLGLVDDILDLSKVEAGRMELRLQTVDTAGVMAQVAALITPLAAHKRVRVDFESPGVGPVVADESKLKQMVLNLVSNAIKFSPDGETVTVKAARVANCLEIAVSDNGIGIAEQDQRRIFKEFQQVDSGAGRKQQGTGLGLALARNLALLHGGNVTVESRLGKGSTFTIAIPIDTRISPLVPAESSIAPVPGKVDGARPLVIVVEDDPQAAGLVASQIERGGASDALGQPQVVAKKGVDE